MRMLRRGVVVVPGRSVYRSLSSPLVSPPPPPQSDSSCHSQPIQAPIGTASPWKIKAQQYTQSALAVGGISLIVYTGWEMAAFLSNITFTNAVSYGFTTGFITAFAVSGTALGVSRMFTLTPETAYKEAMKAIKANRDVIAVLGGPLRPGAFKAYSFDNSYLQTESLWKLPKLKPRQLQILFQVSGSRGHGMVSGEVIKKDGRMQFNSLIVDVLDSGERIILSGDPTKAVYRGHIRLR